MKKINVLLGGVERSLNRVVEASVLDVCYDQAAVETTTTTRLGQFVRHGCMGSFDLMILIPDCLLPEPTQNGPDSLLTETLSAVRSLKSQRSIPLIVLSARTPDHQPFLEAGADSVLREFFQTDPLKSEVRRLLHLPDPAQEARADGWSLAALWLRGLQRLKRA